MSEKKHHKQAESFDADKISTRDGEIGGNGAADNDEANSCSACGRARDAEKDGSDAEFGNGDVKQELERLKAELEDKRKQSADYLEKLQRTAAEYDNFKKRSAKEKEALYIDAIGDVVGAFLPVMDNIERALQAVSADSAAKALKDGVEMVFKQFRDTFKNLGVEEISALNEEFDPMRHNAVMHIEDEAYGHNTVVEEFQKGYIYKDKVIRYSMVKVAN